MKLIRLFCALLLSLIIPLARLLAQDINEDNFSRYTKEQGLSHNLVTALAQDSTGFIWISTASGLNRYDGYNFVQFHSNNNSASIPAEYITGLVWLDSHRLAAYAGGLHVIDTRTGQTRNVFIPYSDKQYQYKFNTVQAVAGNEEGDIFMVTRSGFYHFDKNYHLVFRFDYYPKQEVPTTSFGFGRDLLWLNNKELAIISTMGIYYYSIEKKKFKKMEAADCPLMANCLDYPRKDHEFFQHQPEYFFILNPGSDSITYINTTKNKKVISRLPFLVDKKEFNYRSKVVSINDTLLYLTGSSSGFYKMRLYPESGKVNFYPKKYFPFYYCRDLLQDRNNNLWVATNKGMLREDNSKLYVQQATIPTQVEALFPNVLIDDIYGYGDKLYVATRGYSGLLIFDKQTLQFIRRISLEKCPRSPNNIYSIVSASDTSLLLGTNGPLFRLNLKTDQVKEVMLDQWDNTNDWIADLHKDKKQNIWIATQNVYKYDIATQKISIIPGDGNLFDKIQRPNSIEEDTSGNIWIAGHGLVRYNISSKMFDRLVDSFPYIKIPDREVTSFIADKQNNLWINCYNNGLICYSIDKKTFRHFTTDDGLPDNNISSLIVIGNKLWMACYTGIACLDLNTFRITSFGKEDGFPDMPIFNGTKFFHDASHNKLYIGFASTLVRFDPGIIFQRSALPHLFIENLVTGDQKKFVLPGKSITTSWRNNEITVTIGSVNFFTSASQRFAYRLVKDDSTQWQQLGTQNSFSISNLPAGHNRIQVKLISLNNRWPEQVKEIDIIILPPFWQQTWFRVILGVLALLCIYLFLKWRIWVIRKKERAKTHIQKLKAEEYKSQFELEQISNYFSFSLADKKTTDEVLWDVAKNLIGRMHYVDCMIYVWNWNKTRMIQKAAFGPKGDPIALSNKHFDVAPGEGIVGHVIQTKEPLLVPDTRMDSRYRVDDIERLSEVCVPIIHNNELIGIIDSEHHQENHFKERDVQVLTTIATLVGNKIKQIESEQSLEIKQKEIAFINQQLAEAQLSALQTQMNPHFIFNSLNSIKGMILANEQQKASRYLSKFAQMIRITLSQSRELFTTLYENVEHLENYLVMEKLRFDDSFSYRITVDDHIDKEETLIPTLMIQPLAENAIWHGLMTKKGDKKLAIHFSKEDGIISCCIEDNGIGIKRSERLKQFNKPSHQSVGLANLRNRIKIMNEKYGACCSLEITDRQDLDNDITGTSVILSFDNINNKPRL